MTSRLGGGPTEYQAACALAGRDGQAGGGWALLRPGIELVAAALADRPGQSRLNGRDVVRQIVACPKAPAFVRPLAAAPMGSDLLARSAHLMCNYVPALCAALSCRCNITDGPGRCDWACAGEGTDAGAAVCSLRARTVEAHAGLQAQGVACPQPAQPHLHPDRRLRFQSN